MGIQINGNTNNINAGIGSLSIEDIHELDLTGIATASNFKTGVSNLHNVGLTLSGGQIDVGSNIKIGTAGVVTATTFVGNLTGNVTGTASANAVLTGSTNNTLVTVTGANAITGESALTFNGTDLEIQPASAAPALFIGDSNRSGAGQGLVHFRGNWNGTTVARITIDTGDDTTNKDDGIIRFDTSSTGSLTERVRISSGGRFLVGVSTANTAGSYSSVVSSGAAANNGGFQAHFSGANNGGGGSMTTINAAGGGLDFWTYTGNIGASSYSRRLRIDSSGRVLVGTTDPGGGNADDLTIATSGNTGITIRSGTSNTGNIFFSDATSGAAQYAGAIEFHHSDNSLNFNVGNTNRLHIKSDGVVLLPTTGKLSVGTTNPVARFQVGPANGSRQIEIEEYGVIRGYDRNSNAWAQIDFEASSYSFDCGGTERLNIDSSGRVTKPYTPAFLAYHYGYDINYGVGSTLPFPFTQFNTGNHYNTSNSTFTAPVAGRYLFSINANGNYTSGASGIPRAYWKINGSNVGNAIHLRGSDASHDGLEQRSQTVIFNLAANDTVKMVVGQNQWDLFGANSFTGYLIG